MLLGVVLALGGVVGLAPLLVLRRALLGEGVRRAYIKEP